MTAPDGLVPGGAANFGSLADFAAKTELDWRQEWEDSAKGTWGDDGFLGALFGGLRDGQSFVMAIFEALADALGLGGVWDSIEGILAALKDWFSKPLETTVEFIKGLFEQLAKLLGLNGAWPDLDSILGDIGGFITNITKDILGAILGAGTWTLQQLAAFFGGFVQNAGSFLSQIVKALTGVAGGGLGNLTAWGNDVWAWINNTFAQLQQTWNNLWGRLDLPASFVTLLAGVIPGLDASKIISGKVGMEYIPYKDLNNELTANGSGARMSRKVGAGRMNGAAGSHPFTSFYNNLDARTPDINPNVAGGAFTVTISGWYYVEVGFSVNSNALFSGWNCAPTVYKNGGAYHVGSDAISATFAGVGRGSRTSQSSFMVYLNANDTVSAGYNLSESVAGLFDDGSVENYFGVSLMNRSYA